MKIEQLITRLKEDEIHLNVHNSQLEVHFTSDDALNRHLSEIRENKEDIIDFLLKSIHPFTFSIPESVLDVDYVLSSSQRRLWILSQFSGGSQAYNITGSYLFEGLLDVGALEISFSMLISRHAILRTVFRPGADGTPRQLVLESDGFGFGIICHDYRSEGISEDDLGLLLGSDQSAPFDLSCGPLLRGILYRLTDRRWVFSYTMHHIISDGWSMGILVRELMMLYNSLVSGRPADLPPLRIQYKDYASWQQQELSGSMFESHRSYWKEQFSGILPVLELPTDYRRPAVKSYRGGSVSRHLGLDLLSSLKGFSHSEGGTLFMGLLTGLTALLYRYTGQDDIIVGSPVAGRDHLDLEDQIGMYVNTLALRTHLSGSDRYRELFWLVRHVTLGAYEHQVYPFDELVDELGLRRDMSRNPLFDVLLVLQNTESMFVDGKEFDGLRVSNYPGSVHSSSKFDLTFNFTESGSGLDLGIEYNSDIFSASTVIRMGDHLERLLSLLVSSPDMLVSDLGYLSVQEESLLLYGFNDTKADYPVDQTVIDLFEEQAAQYPDRTAVVFGERTLSYGELNELSNRLAHYLRSVYGIGADDLVGIQLERSEWMIVSILGVLKSGGAYVPVDPEYPQERIAYLLSDSGSRVVIDAQELSLFQSHLSDYDPGNPLKVTGPFDLAYVIYTSGSTGMPKGVMIEHRNVVRLFKTDRMLYDFGPDDVWTLFHSFCFDFSVWEMYGALLFGGKLIVIPTDVTRDPGAYLSVLLHAGVTVLNQTPSSFYNLADEELSGFAKAYRLRYVIFGGEALVAERLQGWHERYPDIRLFNMYGITETTVHATYRELDSEQISSNRNLVGSAIPTLSIYILDDGLRLVGVGIAGQICIGGSGVARGYLNRADLSSSKFIDNPYVAGDRLYLSGDLGRWDSSGNIEFLGRRDDQVKVRGYRIELGEIERSLQGHDLVLSAAVLCEEGALGDKDLVAYVAGASDLDTSVLRSYLSEHLPSYMIPSHYILLESMPLTSNGKIDRKLLGHSSGLALSSGAVYVAPRNAVERALVKVYQDVLKRSGIGVGDDFFVLGGDSIKSIQIVSRLRQEGYSLSIQDIMLHPVIGDLSVHVGTGIRLSDQGLVQGPVGLGPIQHAFFGWSTVDTQHYNHSVLLYSQEPISELALRNSLDRILSHHDALRMVYRLSGSGAWEQYNLGPEQGYELEVVDGCDEASYRAACDRAQSGLDLSEGPLVRACLLRGSSGDRLLLVIHHLVVDGVSWRILFEDLSGLYREYSGGKPYVLPLKTDSFQYWQQHQSLYAASKDLSLERSYWSQIDSLCSDALPMDYAGGSNLMGDVSSVSFVLSPLLTGRLLGDCYTGYHTEINDILISGLVASLGSEFGMDRVSLSLEGHGRERIGESIDVSRTVGWFTSIYPVVLDVVPDALSQVIRVKEHLHRVPNKGIGYGILRYLSSEPYVNSPQISFNYLGDFGQGVGTSEGASLFTFSSDYQGSSVSPYRERSWELEVVGMVVEGRLRLSLSYSRHQYLSSTIENLMGVYQQRLTALIELLSLERQSHKTPVDLTYKGLSYEQVSALELIGGLEDVYRLSPLQEGLYYHWLSSESSLVYFEQMSYRLSGSLDLSALERSYGALIARHGILRTSFTQDYGIHPLQIVRQQVVPRYVYKDVSGDADFSVESYKSDDRAAGFDLGAGSQMRLTVLGLGGDEYEFIWSHHHILMDGWCVGILIREFFELYSGFTGGGSFLLPPVHPYSGYIDWLSRVDQEQSLSYWQQYLWGYETVSGIPKLSLRQDSGHLACEHTITLESGLRSSMRSLCSELGVTENTFIQSVWGLLLSRYNDTDDVVFGAVVSGRPGEVAGVEDMIGLFINTVPVRVRSGALTGSELLQSVHQGSIAGLDHHYTQLAQVQSESQIGRGLFDHILVFENYPVQEMVSRDFGSSGHSGLRLLSSQIRDQTNYDFTLIVLPGEAFSIRFHYNGHVYDRAQMGRLGEHFVRLMHSLVSSPDVLVSDLGYLSVQEESLLLYGFNDTKADYPVDQTVIDLFEEQAAQYPDRTAVVFGERTLSYGELNELSNRLAHYLRSVYGIGADDLVGIQLERSEWMIVSILGVLKSGGAYVPVDPEYPQERIAYLLSDSGSRVVIDAQELSLFQSHLSDYDPGNPLKVNGPFDLAYVIYTSGSTGMPKGCGVSHGNLVNYVLWSNNYYFEELSCPSFGLYSSLSFDLTVTSLYCCLTQGGRLKVYEQETSVSRVLEDSFSGSSGIDSIKLTPSHIELLAGQDISGSGISVVIVGGEALQGSHVEILKKDNAGLRLYNEYGPTETTVGCIVQAVEYGSLPVLIGTPISNTGIYILDDGLRLVGVGVAGQICIGGSGVARGYLNRADLSSSKFIDNPYVAGDRLYLSGDLGRWDSSGSIEFLGRRDDQVKVRGYRIELGEIERSLQGHDLVLSAAVLCEEGALGDKDLVAYVAGASDLDTSVLRSYLSEHLPSYMIPSHYILLESMPLTSNGKIDRKLLGHSSGLALSSGAVYVAPRNAVEAKLVDIWQQVLGREQVGVQDNFFELGGHSLKATRLVSLLHKELGVQMGLGDIFSHPVLCDQAVLIRGQDKSLFISIPESVLDVDYVLSSSQRRLWVLSQFSGGSQAYNITGSYLFEGLLDVGEIGRAHV